MQIALIHDHFDAAKLEAVKSEMAQMGAPVIRAVWMECFGVWAALEGCHRIRAAAELGLAVEIEEVEYCEETTSEDLGLDLQDVLTVAEIADAACNATIIVIEG